MNKLYLILFLVASFNLADCQDLLIRSTYKTVDGLVSGLDAEKVSITKPSISANSIDVSTSNFEIIILNEGYIIDVAKIDSNFVLKKFKEANIDKVGNESHIIDVTGSIIPTKDFTIKLDEVAYYDARINQEVSLPISDVLVTIEKGGEIKMHKNPDIVVYKLRNINKFDYNRNASVPDNTSAKIEEVKPINSEVEVIAEPNNTALVEKDVVEIPTKVMEAEVEYVVEQVENPFEGIETTEISEDEYQRKSLETVAELGNYLSVISDKKVDIYTKTKAKKEAFELFTGEEATVEVSNVRSQTVRTQKIKVYLEKLQRLNYDKVDIRWSEVGYVSSLRPDVDGNLWGTVSIKQKFTGYRDGIAVYSDVTYKEIEVKFETYSKSVGGEQVREWDVYLNNIGVAVTKLN